MSAVAPPGRAISLSISAVERDTGLSKDTLRVWERRYGFPAPERDLLGERLYPFNQVEKLRIVKRLMDAGHRPGRVVPMPLADLQHLAGASNLPLLRASAALAPGAAVELEGTLALLRSHDVEGLRRQWTRALAHMGLQSFVVDLVGPLNTRVGDAWMRGEVQVFEEHLYTELLQAVLRQALGGLGDTGAPGRPRVLLTTFPGEPHGLGLLMAQTLFALEGCPCVSLGVQTPVLDTVLAARALQCDLVALSFTACLKAKLIVDGLTELRAKLPRSVELWVGGSAPVLRKSSIDGVTLVDGLAQIGPRLASRRGNPG